MKPIVVDADLWRLLQPVELCDASGKVLGRFTPNIDPELLAKLVPELSEEELQRREREPGRSLAAIMADLQKHA